MKWPVVTLYNALASAEVFVDGDWVESKDQDPNGDVRLIQLADVGDGEYIDKSNRFLTNTKAHELRCTFLRSGDVLVARMPDPLGRACIFPGDSKSSVTVVDICIIRPNQEKHDPRWLMHCLNAPICRSQVAGFATGSTRSRISRGNLGKIKVPFPPLTEQRRIARVLDRANAVRIQRRAALAELDTLTQSIFLEMFGDPFAQNVKSVRLGDVAEILMGQSPPGSSYNTNRGGIPLLNGPTEFGEQYPIEAQWTTEPTRLCQAGDILFCVRGATAGRLNHADKEYCLGRGLAAIRPRIEMGVNSHFLFTVLSRYYGYFQAKGVGSTFINIKREELESLPIPHVQKDGADTLAQRVSSVEALKATHKVSLSQLDALFASLQHQVFGGEL